MRRRRFRCYLRFGYFYGPMALRDFMDRLQAVFKSPDTCYPSHANPPSHSTQKKFGQMPTLVLLRHGPTQWARENRFAGWADTSLSDTGVKAAKAAGKLLAKSDLSFDLAFTSMLGRAQDTLSIVAECMNLPGMVTVRDWRLNERHYGALQGETRISMVQRHGNQKIVQWRRSFEAVPPPLEDDDPRWAEQLARIPELPVASHPRSESMAQAADRAQQLWHERIGPELREGKNILVVAHSSSIRGLVRIVERLDEKATEEFMIATVIPRVYNMDNELRVTQKADLKAGMPANLRYWLNWLKPRGLGWV